MKWLLWLLGALCAALLIAWLLGLFNVPVEQASIQTASVGNALTQTGTDSPAQANASLLWPATPAPVQVARVVVAPALVSPATPSATLWPASELPASAPAVAPSPSQVLVPFTQLIPIPSPGFGQGGGSNGGGGGSSAPSTTAAPTPDTTAPVIAAHSDVAATTTSDTATSVAVTYSAPTATDDTDGAVAVSCTPVSGSTFTLGSNTVTCTAHDVALNYATTTFSVVVTQLPDTTAPVITGTPTDIATTTASDTATSMAVIYTVPTSTDDKDGTVAVSCTPASGSTFSLGTTPVVCSAQDAAANVASTTFNVVVTQLPDTTVPVIVGTPNSFSVEATSSNSVVATVTYTAPTATDDKDGSVAVSCIPASGSDFAVGTTTVTCTAQDAASNATSTSFDVGVYTPAPAVPVPFVMASQPDESYLCPSPDGWSGCFTNQPFGFSVDLGKGDNSGGYHFADGSLLSVAVALDPTYVNDIPLNTWSITIACYTDASYTLSCSDWVAGNSSNGNQNSFVIENATSTADSTHWTAYFTDPTREANIGGSSPVVFNPLYYYRLTIDDNGVGWPAYGSESPALPFWVITGVAQ